MLLSRSSRVLCPVRCHHVPVRHWSSAPLGRCVSWARSGAHSPPQPPEMVLWGVLFVFQAKFSLFCGERGEPEPALPQPPLPRRNAGLTLVLTESMFRLYNKGHFRNVSPPLIYVFSLWRKLYINIYMYILGFRRPNLSPPKKSINMKFTRNLLCCWITLVTGNVGVGETGPRRALVPPSARPPAARNR